MNKEYKYQVVMMNLTEKVQPVRSEHYLSLLMKNSDICKFFRHNMLNNTPHASRRTAHPEGLLVSGDCKNA